MVISNIYERPHFEQDVCFDAERLQYEQLPLDVSDDDFWLLSELEDFDRFDLFDNPSMFLCANASSSSSFVLSNELFSSALSATCSAIPSAIARAKPHPQSRLLFVLNFSIKSMIVGRLVAVVSASPTTSSESSFVSAFFAAEFFEYDEKW